LIECFRVLKNKGIMVFKCQDIIHNHRLHSTHVNVINWANGFFRLKDMFILNAKHRMPMPNQKTQKHARIYHSYFLILECQK
jgi:DNA modification methylase